jgi:hypothetical protein|tara:strand:+ start:10 stop:375 length:366 start_codon:yes stop_codon:yes gene_type:complete
MNKFLKPKLNQGEYVFVLTDNIDGINEEDILCSFKEDGKYSLILKKEFANKYGMSYNFVAAWISLDLYSSLDSVGLTSMFSKALSDNNITCNVVAAFNHDHIFVNYNDKELAFEILNKLNF